MQASRLKIYELINDLKRLEINKLRSNKLRKANTFRDLCALYDGTSTKHFDYRPSKEASTQSSSSSSATTQDDCDTSESSLLSNGIGGEEQIEDSIYTDIDGDFDTSGDGNNNINSINLGDKEELHELENLKKLPVVINKLFKKYVSTGGANGVKIQYHQRLPLFAAFAGYASVRLGDVALSKYKVELSNLFHTKYFDKKQEVKFGRRAGKSYLACVIIACLLISQDNCSGTFICYDKILATVNLITIQRILEEIINDPEQGYSNVKVELSKADNTISVITGRETNKALINKVRCTANPSKASMRGKGNHKGFMFLDESDFYPQKVFDEIMPIAALNILVCFYSSQGFSEAPASRMVKTSILANGRRVWRQFRMTPGRVSLVISEDYGNVSRDMASDLIVSRKESNNLNSKINVVPSVSDIPVRSTMRPWYSPVAQTLALRRKELQSASARKEQWSSLLNNSTSLPSPPSSKTSVSTQPPASSSSTSTTATPLRQKSSKDININEIGGFVPFSSGKCKRVITNKTMNLIKSNNDRLSSIISQTDILNENEWTTDECIFLATLPEQTPPGQMMALKYDMGPEAFAREMLNKEESVNAVLVEAFDGFLIDSVFNPDNYVDPSASRNGDPLYWIIALDPGGVGASDTFIVSALVLEKDLPPLVNDTTSTFSIEMLTRSNNSASASTSSSSAHKKNVNIAESLVSSSLKHKILVRLFLSNTYTHIIFYKIKEHKLTKCLHTLFLYNSSQSIICLLAYFSLPNIHRVLNITGSLSNNLRLFTIELSLAVT